MARFALNIYGENDEIIKRYETNRIAWGVFQKAIKLDEGMRTPEDDIEAIGEIIKMMFVGMTDEELAKADFRDIISVFTQLTRQASLIRSGDGEKN